MNYFAYIAVILASLAACAAKQVKLEPIYGVRLDDIHAEFIVRSTGCTKAQDFSLEVTHETLLLKRMKVDTCRRKPFLKTIRLPLAFHDQGKALINPVFLGQQ